MPKKTLPATSIGSTGATPVEIRAYSSPKEEDPTNKWNRAMSLADPCDSVELPPVRPSLKRSRPPRTLNFNNNFASFNTLTRYNDQRDFSPLWWRCTSLQGRHLCHYNVSSGSPQTSEDPSNRQHSYLENNLGHLLSSRQNETSPYLSQAFHHA